MLTFLGLIVDSTLCTFLIPEVKKKKFADLRESILKGRSVSVRTLQHFAGKIASFSIAVPSAQLYAQEIYRAFSGYSKSSRPVKVTGTLRKELEHWPFLDTWRDCLPWPCESHFIVKVFTDASNFAWGGVIQIPDKSPISVRDYWPGSACLYPIVVKEACALVLTLQACKPFIFNSRLAVHTDNMAFMHSWQKQGGKNPQLNDALKDLSSTLLESNATAPFHFIPSSCNPADFPLRTLSNKDCMLSESAWLKVDSRFGPHTLNMMSLDSNAQKDASGNLLTHFNPFPTPLSTGVNVFAQVIQQEENAYIFPPFVLVGPPLKFLESSIVSFTIVVPQLDPLPFWWPILRSRATSWIKLGKGTLACSFAPFSFLGQPFCPTPPHSGICLPSDITRCDLSAVHLSGLSSPFPRSNTPAFGGLWLHAQTAHT